MDDEYHQQDSITIILYCTEKGTVIQFAIQEFLLCVDCSINCRSK